MPSFPLSRRAIGFAALPPCCAALLLVVSSHARADGGADGPEWTFGGFGSAGLVHSSERHADYTANVLNPGDAGFSRRWSPNVDSRVGGQVAVDINERWSAVLQVVAERSLTASYRPQVEWANVSYQVTPDLKVRIGRIALPIFLVGDSRKASYALPWVRPPVEVYAGIPVSNSDGIDASYRWRAGMFNNVTQVFYGHTRVKTSDSSEARANALSGLSNTMTSNALTLRASVLTTTLSLDLARPLFDAFRQFGAQGAVLADRYDVKGKRSTAASIGLAYDPGAWFFMSELSRFNTDSFVGDKTAWYASAGYRLGDMTPFVTYGSSKSNRPTDDAGLAPAGLPAPLAGAAQQLNAGLALLLDAVPVQHSVSLGARWDVLPGRALTLQYDRLLPQGGSNGTLRNVQPGFRSGVPVHVVSALFDFVF